MPRRKASSAHDQLARLSEEVSAARGLDREAQETVRAAEAEVARLREAIRMAHETGSTPGDLGGDLKRAKEAIEGAQLAQQGISRRAQRASDERQRFIKDNADRLLDELRPSADEAVAAIQRHAEALLAADRRWHDISGEVAAYLAAAGTVPVGNSHSDSGFSTAAREVKHALRNGIATPLPHFTHRKLQLREEQYKLRVKAARQASGEAETRR
jgi:hypothetical protein